MKPEKKNDSFSKRMEEDYLQAGPSNDSLKRRKTYNVPSSSNQSDSGYGSVSDFESENKRNNEILQADLALSERLQQEENKNVQFSHINDFPMSLNNSSLQSNINKIGNNNGIEDSAMRALDAQTQMQIQQLHYNDNRIALATAISYTLTILLDFQVHNHDWPAFYPSIFSESSSSLASNNIVNGNSNSNSNDNDSINASNNNNNNTFIRPPLPTNASYCVENINNKNINLNLNSTTEPRIISPELANNFNILKVDLKMGHGSSSDLVHSLEKKSIASLLDGKINSAIKHLVSLRERIEDTSSKVLVTGDLNAGKSTFCNSLLRRKVLPEDQQPCTNVFCEILDAQKNGGTEEAHAIPHGVVYNRLDESTYEIHPLSDLENLVEDNEKYSLIKVYVDDYRPINKSLLRNGVIDVSLIDAPGLNLDSMQTTALFARQEEIDVIVFVVSAENHFTLSAKEFIWNAANEKAFIFIVVNRFDNIKNKKKCMRTIYDQVSALSPQTLQKSNELVHFVSSSHIQTQSPTNPPDPGDSDGDDDDNDENNNNDDNNENKKNNDNDNSKKSQKEKNIDDKNNDPEEQQLEMHIEGGSQDDIDFERLESCLRNFILEKRSISKLAPARTYLLNLLDDIKVLAKYNQKEIGKEKDMLEKELNTISPAYEEALLQSIDVNESIDHLIEKVSTHLFDHTREQINDTIAEVISKPLVEYNGIFDVLNYAIDTREAMIEHIHDSVLRCEEEARQVAVNGVNEINQIGILHLSDQTNTSGKLKDGEMRQSYFSANKVFRSEYMFTRRKDILSRLLVAELQVSDFIDFETHEKTSAALVTSASLSMTLVAQQVSISTWVTHFFNVSGVISKVHGNDRLSWWVLPVSIGAIAATAVAAYIVWNIPNAIPKKLAKKLSSELEDLDYVQGNASRLSNEVAKIMRVPASEIRIGFQRKIDDLSKKKESRSRRVQESNNAFKYFSKLYRDAYEQSRIVNQIILE